MGLLEEGIYGVWEVFQSMLDSQEKVIKQFLLDNVPYCIIAKFFRICENGFTGRNGFIDEWFLYQPP